MLRWRVFILKIPNPVMAQYNKGHKYMINFKLVNDPSRFPLKPAQVLVIRNFICSLQRHCESLMLKKNELTLKREKRICIYQSMWWGSMCEKQRTMCSGVAQWYLPTNLLLLLSPSLWGEFIHPCSYFSRTKDSLIQGLICWRSIFLIYFCIFINLFPLRVDP